MPVNLALFDLDHTLLPIDSDHAWGQFLCDEGMVDAAAYKKKNDAFMLQYESGTLDIMEFLAFGLAPLVSITPRLLRSLHDRYMDQVIRPRITARALELVAAHGKAGDICAIVTATNAFVTAPIARAFGVSHLIATVPAQEGGKFNGAVRGTPCFREGKIVRVTEWMEQLGLSWESLTTSTFYSDSRNDLPLLERVTVPVATNSDSQLRAHATARQWRMLELFND